MCLEFFYYLLKKEQGTAENSHETLRENFVDALRNLERHGLLLFMDVLFKLISSWSLDRNPASNNCLYFADAPSTSTKDYTDAYQWARANVPTIEKIVNGKRYVIFNCREAGPITSRAANKVLKTCVRSEY
jgi:hypothetical protein